MTYGSTEIPVADGKQLSAKLHRQALATIAAIGAVTLVAVCVVLSRGSVYTGLLQVQPMHNGQQLYDWQGYDPEAEGDVLDLDPMSEFLGGVGNFEDASARVPTYQGEYPDYAAIVPPFAFGGPVTAGKAVQTQQLSARPQALYDWQGYDPEAEGDELDLDPMTEFLGGVGNFEDASARVPTYQGEYPDYAAIVPPFAFGGPVTAGKAVQTQQLTGLKTVQQLKGAKAQSLYDWAGYDPTAEGDELDLEPMTAFLGGVGNFEDPSGRVPTYQGEYPDYAAIVPPFAFGGPVTAGKDTKTQQLLQK